MGFAFSGTWTTGWSLLPRRQWPDNTSGDCCRFVTLWECDKQREVRSRALAVCNLLGHDHRYPSCQGHSHPGAGGKVPLGGRAVPYCGSSPRSGVAGAVVAPVVAGEAGSSRASSNALPAVAFEDPLVPRVGSSLSPHPQGPVLCSNGGRESRNEGLSRARQVLPSWRGQSGVSRQNPDPHIFEILWWE